MDAPYRNPFLGDVGVDVTESRLWMMLAGRRYLMQNAQFVTIPPVSRTLLLKSADLKRGSFGCSVLVTLFCGWPKTGGPQLLSRLLSSNPVGNFLTGILRFPIVPPDFDQVNACEIRMSAFYTHAEERR